MKTTYYLIGFTTLVAMVALTCSSHAETPAVSSAMAGHWQGNARIVVSWCRQTNLPVTLEIYPNGSVTGTVGDAILTNARLVRNRGWIGRKLRIKTDYIVQGRLTGAVIAAEGIHRSGVNIPLNFNGTVFKGGVHTTGSKIGGKEHMVLSAGWLVLSRTP